jgi:hypothetical protein
MIDHIALYLRLKEIGNPRSRDPFWSQLYTDSKGLVWCSQRILTMNLETGEVVFHHG